MPDLVFDGFLDRQNEEGKQFDAESDIVDITPVGGRSPPRRYRVSFRCRGLIRNASDAVVEHDHFEVGIHFPPDYLRHVNPWLVLAWLRPINIWHPNILFPHICVGRLAPGTGIVDLVYQLHSIITYNKKTTREDDALNRPACSWARRNQHRFPVDTRPLKRRKLELVITPKEEDA